MAVARDEPQTPELKVWLAPVAGEVVGDEDEIRGAVANLLDNAVEASEADRRPVEIRTGMADGRAFVEIKDEGCGIAPADVERLFRPFHTTKTKGTGLGLVIARSAVEAAGGKVTLAPREEGKGAVARIELAMAAAPGLEKEKR
ncbi:MAG: ATP-binding protein [Myxococcales bacterium]